MGKPCVVGAEDILVNVHQRQAIIGDKVLHEGDVVTIDGGTGRRRGDFLLRDGAHEAELPTRRGLNIASVDKVAHVHAHGESLFYRVNR